MGARIWKLGVLGLGLTLVAGGCAPEAHSRAFCVVDTDCPGELICDEGVCWAGAEPAPELPGAAGGGGSGGSSAPAHDADSMDSSGDDPDATPDDALTDGEAGTSGDALTPEEPFQNPAGQSRCQISETHAECTHNDTQFMNRLVVWQVPLGEAPAGGWPTVVVFQGSGFGPDVTWAGDSSLPFGGFHQIRVQAALLDHGFAVIAPAADGVAWATNFPNYEGSTDHVFIPALLDALEAGEFGALDTQRLYATGISSGGYMTSRMAVTYPGHFAALAIQSGSYASCSNVLCAIPTDLPDDHPPTLFLHGQNDVAVPIATMQAYDAALKAQGTETKVVIDPAVGHGWLKVAPEEITQWFMDH